MGSMVELNTLLRPPESFAFSSLVIGKTYEIILARERAFPLHIAILVVDAAWNFYGYAVAHEATITKGKTTIRFEMLSVFTNGEGALYKEKFLEAAQKTGEA